MELKNRRHHGSQMLWSKAYFEHIENFISVVLDIPTRKDLT